MGMKLIFEYLNLIISNIDLLSLTLIHFFSEAFLFAFYKIVEYEFSSNFQMQQFVAFHGKHSKFIYKVYTINLFLSSTLKTFLMYKDDALFYQINLNKTKSFNLIIFFRKCPFIKNLY